jgi:acyl carrier protein
MNSPIFEEVRTIAADVFQVAPQDLTPDSAPAVVSAWDSVQHLNLLLALEERFGLQFEPEEIDGMKNLGAIAMLLHNKVGSANSNAA